MGWVVDVQNSSFRHHLVLRSVKSQKCMHDDVGCHARFAGFQGLQIEARFQIPMVKKHWRDSVSFCLDNEAHHNTKPIATAQKIVPDNGVLSSKELTPYTTTLEFVYGICPAS